MRWPQAKERHLTAEARNGKKLTVPLEPAGGVQPCCHLEMCERTRFCCVKPPACVKLLQQSQETNTSYELNNTACVNQAHLTMESIGKRPVRLCRLLCVAQLAW